MDSVSSSIKNELVGRQLIDTQTGDIVLITRIGSNPDDYDEPVYYTRDPSGWTGLLRAHMLSNYKVIPKEMSKSEITELQTKYEKKAREMREHNRFMDDANNNLLKILSSDSNERIMHDDLQRWLNGIVGGRERASQRDETDLSQSILLSKTDIHCAYCKVSSFSNNPHKKCSRCMTEYYCSRGCQLKHWADHKKSCKSTTQ